MVVVSLKSVPTLHQHCSGPAQIFGLRDEGERTNGTVSLLAMKLRERRWGEQFGHEVINGGGGI
jgi:hypothetical protein